MEPWIHWHLVHWPGYSVGRSVWCDCRRCQQDSQEHWLGGFPSAGAGEFYLKAQQIAHNFHQQTFEQCTTWQASHLSMKPTSYNKTNKTVLWTSAQLRNISCKDKVSDYFSTYCLLGSSSCITYTSYNDTFQLWFNSSHESCHTILVTSLELDQVPRTKWSYVAGFLQIEFLIWFQTNIIATPKTKLMYW